MTEHESAAVTIADLGEAATIARISEIASSDLNGDDAAVLERVTANMRTVVSTDMLLPDVHFRTRWITPYELGQKAITRNFADIEAMGARPQAALLALAIPRTTEISWVESFARGMAQRLEEYQAELVGGDLSHAAHLGITVTALGQLGGRLPALQLDDARCGQQVIASGVLGYAAAGLALLEQQERATIPAEFEPLIQAQCSLPRCPGRGFVARAKGASALTDNSDGLLHDLGLIAQRSSVHIRLDQAAIAPDALLEAAGAYLGVDPWTWVLAGGEDHALLGTTSHEVPTGFRHIGEVCERNGHGQVSVPGIDMGAVVGWESI